MKTLKHGNAVASLTGGALMMYDIIVLEDFLFMRRHEDDKPAFSKKLHSGDHFRKSAFLVPENSVYVWTKGQNGEKNLRFRENIRIGVRGTLIACVASVFVLFRESKTARKMAPPPPSSFIFGLSFHFSRGQNRGSRSSVFPCSETARKRLLRRLGP